MDLVGLPIASSVAGVVQAERNAVREAAKPEPRPGARFRRLQDNADLTVTETETLDAVRDPKGNDQEESHEDRQEHAQSYDAHGFRPKSDKPHLDVEG